MAMTNLGADSAAANITVAELHHVAGALRRLNIIGSVPVLTAEDREEVYRAKQLCWAVVANAAEALVSLIDAIAGDPDLEENGDELDGTNAEDEIGNFSGDGGAGCPIADPGGCEHDGREPDPDAEIETWSHPDDHPADLFVGVRSDQAGKDA